MPSQRRKNKDVGEQNFTHDDASLLSSVAQAPPVALARSHIRKNMQEQPVQELPGRVPIEYLLARFPLAMSPLRGLSIV